ncbi:branched-chain-amino-acid aminotransferase 3, chloroplastic-like [Gossypium australe]|uniref:Branched-chain-amino-acid aminotransferase 3, chloroplastic-like n=1 Tax=Gossypium australe TaxID=47621 RepID=A0A5B6UV16_9ROSI|nr:branched-chain-amino-acid aminotransferase 3, chloroplastic-like [Gossypium australe]
MEINAVLANLQPNYLLCPSSRSSISTTSAAATFLPLSSSLHTRFSNISFPFLFLLLLCRNINETNSPFKSAAVLSDSYSSEVSELADIEWDYLGFGLLQTYYMYMMKCTQGGNFCKGDLQRKEGNILLFHPEGNALRMRLRAKRMCTPLPTVEKFVEAVKEIVLANKSWVTNSHDLKHEFGLQLAFHAL